LRVIVRGRGIELVTSIMGAMLGAAWSD